MCIIVELAFPEVGMCTSGTVTGKSVTILSGSVPSGPANCYCDVTVDSCSKIVLNYDGPDVSGCNMTIEFAGDMFSCYDGAKTYCLTSSNRLKMSKERTDQTDWCMLIRSGNSSKTC